MHSTMLRSLFVFALAGLPALAQPKKDAPPPTREELEKDLKPAPGFKANVFAMPPDVSYPTCIAAAVTGEVFVGTDLNGSLDAKPGRGAVIRCVDVDHDGVADKFTTFCKIESPRGLHFFHNKLIVLAPPDLSVFYDDDGDGVADRSEVLVKGIGFDLKFRGADHTTNGFRMGIDGWLYIAVGDYGIKEAVGKDGRKLQLIGGGIVRVRPDGTEMEIVSRGQRNIYDVAIDPFMNLFTRDNTNDGGGWNVRLSHVIPLADMGYPKLFKNFPSEHLDCLVDYGGGSPCGALYLDEPGFPKDWGNALYTVDWGVNTIFRHPLKEQGASYAKKPEQIPLIKMSRPTDMDVDGSGQIFVTSWRGGNYTYSNPHVGYVARIVPEGWKYVPAVDLAKMSDADVLERLKSASHTHRLNAQQELTRRKYRDHKTFGAIRWNKSVLATEVAVMYTYKMLFKEKAEIFAQTADPKLHEFAVKILSDRVGEANKISTDRLTGFLNDENPPRVRLQALIALGRLARTEAAAEMLPLTDDPDPAIAHIAVESLILLKPIDVCLRALNEEKHAAGALRVLQAIHESKVVDALIARAEKSKAVLPALCRLYYTEGEFGKWWGTRPDTTGPYYYRTAWAETDKIGAVLKKALKSADAATAKMLVVEMRKHRIDFPEAVAHLRKLIADEPAFRSQGLDLLLSGSGPLPDGSEKDLLRIAVDAKESAEVRVKALRGLHAHVDDPGYLAAAIDSFSALTDVEAEKGPLSSAWEDFARDAKLGPHLPKFLALSQDKDASRREFGYAILLHIVDSKFAKAQAKADALKALDQAWARPDRLAEMLRAIRKTKADHFGLQVKTLLNDSRPEIKALARDVVKSLGLDEVQGTRVVLKGQAYDKVFAAVLKEKGDAKLGQRIFLKAACIACHTVNPTDPVKGPYLGDVAGRYKRPELIESILKPNAKLTQGFETNFFVLNDGRIIEGFVTKESGDEVELRNAAGVALIVAKKDIDERGRRLISVMPDGLMDALTMQELAALLAYLESLNAKKP